MIGNHRRRALVIDDDEQIRVMVTAILQGSGFVVTTARDGEEGIALLGTRQFHLILLDLMMPKVDGFGVLKFLHQRRPELLAKVVIMSAMSVGELQERFPARMEKVIQKPFDIHLLVSYAEAVANVNH